MQRASPWIHFVPLRGRLFRKSCDVCHEGFSVPLRGGKLFLGRTRSESTTGIRPLAGLGIVSYQLCHRTNRNISVFVPLRGDRLFRSLANPKLGEDKFRPLAGWEVFQMRIKVKSIQVIVFVPLRGGDCFARGDSETAVRRKFPSPRGVGSVSEPVQYISIVFTILPSPRGVGSVSDAYPGYR